VSEDIRRLPMACSCGDERRAIWDELFRETAVKVGGDPDGDWLNPFLSDITTYYSAEVRIIGDQWMRVTVEPYGSDITLSIDCDRFEHGIAALWLALREHYPDGYRPPDEDDEEDDDDD